MAKKRLFDRYDLNGILVDAFLKKELNKFKKTEYQVFNDKEEDYYYAIKKLAEEISNEYFEGYEA